MLSRHCKLSKSSHGLWSAVGWPVMAGAIAPIVLVAPAWSANLQEWTFDPQTYQLTVIVPEGVTPRYFLLAEPARIVLELPDTTLGEGDLVQSYAGVITSIRFSAVPGGVRGVMEFAPNTLLDPRHAELTSTAIGNGQVEWTLYPLLHDPAPIADGSASVSVSAAEVSMPEEPESDSTTAVSEARPAASTPGPVTAVPEAPDGSTTPVIVDRPDPAQAAISGVAQALTDASDAFAGVRTDAAALAGVGSEVTSDLPPDQLAIDPWAAAIAPTGPGTSAEDPTRAPLPQVSVPPLADVPAVPPVVATTAEPDASGAAPAPPDEAAIAVAPMNVPSLPAPPDTWSDPVLPAQQPNQVRPPDAAVASAPVSPVLEEEEPEAPAIAARNPQSARGPIPEPTRTEAIAPPSTGEVQPPPSRPPSARVNQPPFPATEAPTVAGIPAPPPFLARAESEPTAGEPSIPPPPPVPSRGGVVPFGAPLPSQVKGLEPSSGNDSVELGEQAQLLPVGTRLILQYPGTEPLILEQQAPVYEVLLVAEAVRHPDTNALLIEKGTQVLGRFEGFDESGRRFVAQVLIAESDRTPVLAESDWLLGTPQQPGGNVLINSGIGAAALTVLSGFSGFGLLGGAALGAASGLTGAPRLVSIEPGQRIEVEIVADILPFNDAPTGIQ